MKSTVKVILALASLLILFTCTSSAQTVYELYGEQTRGTGYGADAVIKCQGVQFNGIVTIVDVSGDNAGFWITDQDNVVLARYDTMKEAIGVKINPGTYFIYPNLKKNQSKATIYMFYQ